MKKKKLVWNAFYFDFNDKKKLETENVIRDDLIDEIMKAKKKHQIASREDLKKIAKSNFMYHYWSKCEWEYVVSDLWGKGEHKLDIWYQLELNLDRIVDYLWENLMETEKDERKFIRKMRKLDPFLQDDKKELSLDILWDRFNTVVHEMGRLEDIEDDRIQMQAYIDYLKERLEEVKNARRDK